MDDTLDFIEPSLLDDEARQRRVMERLRETSPESYELLFGDAPEVNPGGYRTGLEDAAIRAITQREKDLVDEVIRRRAGALKALVAAPDYGALIDALLPTEEDREEFRLLPDPNLRATFYELLVVASLPGTPDSVLNLLATTLAIKAIEWRQRDDDLRLPL